MAQIEKKELSPVEWEVKIVISPEDYLPAFKEELKKLKGKVNFPGFRKGKVPVGFLRKTLGGEVLPPILFQVLEDQINALAQKEGRKLFLKPLPLQKDNQQLALEPKKDKDYIFSYIFSLLPQLNISEKLFEEYKEPLIVAKPTEKEVLSHWESFLIKLVEQDEGYVPAEKIDEDTKIVELKALWGDGKEARLKLSLANIPKDKTIEKLTGLKKGEELPLKMADIEYLITHIDDMDVEEELPYEIEELYEVEEVKLYVEEILHFNEEKLNITQEHFDSIFGKDKVHSREEALTSIRKHLEIMDMPLAMAMWTKKFYLHLREQFAEQLIPPAVYMEKREKLYEEEPLSERLLSLVMLKDVLVDYLKIKISQEQLDAELIYHLGLFNMPEKEQRNILQHIYSNPSQYRGILDKVHSKVENFLLEKALKEKVNPEEKEIGKEAFYELYEEIIKQFEEVFDMGAEEEEEE